MSPFGNLYGVPVVVDRVLGESAEIVCNAGSHTDTLKMRYQDFARLVKPKVGAFGKHISGTPKRKRVGRKPRLRRGKPTRRSRAATRSRRTSSRRR